MGQIIEYRYNNHFITGSDNARYVYIDPQGHFSSKSYSTLEECEAAIDAVSYKQELTYRGFDTYTDAELFRKFLISYNFEVVGMEQDIEHRIWKVHFCGKNGA